MMIRKSLATIFWLATVTASTRAVLGSHGVGLSVSPGRRLKQLEATMSINPQDPISATTADLENDPTGRGHLLARLQGASSYVQDYTYNQTAFPPDVYNVPVNIDPTAATGLTGAAQNGSWRVVGNSGSVPVHALPFTNGLVLFMQRGTNANGTGFNPDLVVSVGNTTETEMGAIYNLTDNTFKPFHIKEHPFCSGQTLLPNGKGIVVGGDPLNLNGDFLTNGIQAIRLFDMETQTYELVNTMGRGRWYPSVTVMADGNLLIVGGLQQEGGGWVGDMNPSSSEHPTVSCSANAGGSVADPTYNNPTFQIMYSGNFSLTPSLTLTILLKSWPQNSYPFLVQLPQGSILIIAGSLMEALFFTPDGASRDNAIGLLPSFPVPVNYPSSGAMTLLDLQGPDYNATVLVAGGNAEYCANADTPGGSKSWIFDVTPGGNHTLIEEETAFPRVMGELTLLPDGRALYCNGAQLGTAGGAGPASAAGTNGATVAEIYDPTKPYGKRWSTVADSKIWRLYHSEAFLTANAEVFVSGSDTTNEHRVQIYTPDYLHTTKPRPVIASLSDTDVGYAQNFTIKFSNVTSLDRVVFNRLVGSTHGVHTDQRQIVLDCTFTSSTATCTTPPNNFVAPPGQYYLFVLSEGIPSVAKYISLQLPASTTDTISTAG